MCLQTLIFSEIHIASSCVWKYWKLSILILLFVDLHRIANYIVVLIAVISLFHLFNIFCCLLSTFVAFVFHFTIMFSQVFSLATTNNNNKNTKFDLKMFFCFVSFFFLFTSFLCVNSYEYAWNELRSIYNSINIFMYISHIYKYIYLLIFLQKKTSLYTYFPMWRASRTLKKRLTWNAISQLPVCMPIIRTNSVRMNVIKKFRAALMRALQLELRQLLPNRYR